MTSHQVPPAERKQLKLGYMRLTDSAPVIMARELGLYEEFGLDVELVRDVSWANLRDRLVMADLDAAQMLAPLPMMTSYGAGGMRANMLTGLGLSLNGNAITVSNRLWSELGLEARPSPPAPQESSARLKQLVDASRTRPTFTFATVHLFSMHTILLRMWLQSGGIDPDQDVRIIVLPPEQMCDSLSRGIIDGYCVGEPWNSMAVYQGIGSVVSSGYHIWNNAPEKVLAVTESWHQSHPGTHVRLRLALMKACQYLANLDCREEVASILSREEYLNIPRHILLPSLSGDFRYSRNQSPARLPDFHIFWLYQAGFPWRSNADFLVRQCAFSLAGTIGEAEIKNLVQQCYRTDLYREAARYLDIPAPAKDTKTDGIHDAIWEFEPGIKLGPDLILPPHGKQTNQDSSGA